MRTDLVNIGCSWLQKTGSVMTIIDAIWNSDISIIIIHFYIQYLCMYNAYLDKALMQLQCCILYTILYSYTIDVILLL